MQSSPVDDHGPSLASLPPELILNIMSFVGTHPQDWRDARLVSRDWANYAAPHIFSGISLAPWTLHRLEDLRSLKSISPYVRHLKFFPIALPEAWRERWHDAIQYRRLKSKDWVPWNPHEAECRFQAFLAVSQQQERFVGAVDTRYWPLQVIGKSFACLENAIRSFDKLESITVDSGPRPSSKNVLLLYVENPRLYHDLDRLDYWDAPHRSFGNTFLETVLRTLGEAGRSLSCLRAGPIMSTDLETLSDLGDKAKRAIRSTIAQLTCFQVKIEFPPGEFLDPRPGKAGKENGLLIS
ncbi:MAG: hypothetical protein Q9212_003412 [Teloschistes hypoglaucus]